ncbi:TatD family hydrolase [Marinomonas posidonica]|uniref:TatD-related deoxyribonuclease n=1 Tax=Marinomonas posidonica (strain CECT 7376 / NCIMB 14433 / IVIA-Po-181) TaxID=491952 RepID=F6D0I4_MARPP|nr:TatD family hydrolase [Marinomonas posidonica]AEF54782.1 TatD-related deoxyribonuclease [Marinomonas posidonica IVIA-Po-181]
MIDIGVNLNHSLFLDDLEHTLLEAKQQGVNGIICIASDLEESQLLTQYSRLHPSLWQTIGCHPHQAKTWHADSQQIYRALLHKHQAVAIGETGLDFNRNYSTQEQQRFAFHQQIDLAKELALPLYLHERDAHEEMIATLKQHPEVAQNSVIHCFTGSRRELDHYLELGLYIGITGWVCDERRGSDLQTSVPHIPLDRLLLETDAPYLLPRNIRPRPKKNHPKYLPYVAEEVARLRNMTVEALIKASVDNTHRLFNLPANIHTS